MKKEIFKIQVPQFSSDGDAQAYIYNKDKSQKVFIPVTKGLLEFMDGEPKVYVYGYLGTDKLLHISEEVEEQVW